ncbi:hypothetical protein [Blattabacterium cuenoti]|uniref:hypothetical protein n=1 Tax=Blattabacterium cuenoti TaxID=1653831 RepID=UPI001CC24848|nr:hypothetical protein [Blattabacterium cuenoti]
MITSMLNNVKMNRYKYFCHGKLLLTGEYFLLCGSMGIALPTIKGQSLTVFNYEKNCSYPLLHWKSLDEFNHVWFEAIFKLPSLDIYYETEKKTSLFLQRLLLLSKKNQKKFLTDSFNINVYTKLEFSIDWGLGSSSTLINNIAKWANISPYLLIGNDFLGSGYDIACGNTSRPIIYQVHKKKNL